LDHKTSISTDGVHLTQNPTRIEESHYYDTMDSCVMFSA